MNNSDAAATVAGLALFPLLLGVIVLSHLLFAWPFYVMAQKTNSDHAWFAFVPILNLLLMAELAGKEAWWGILLMVPCINIVVWVIVCMGMAETMNKPSWVGLLMLVPGINWIIPFYLAYG